MYEHLDVMKTFGQMQTQNARDARNLKRLSTQGAKIETEQLKTNLPKSEQFVKKGG